MNKQELIKKVEAWHIERETNDLEKQLIYLGAELGEFMGAYLKNDRAEMIDGLGDTFVVLINIARLTQHEINVDREFECLDDITSLAIAMLQRISGFMLTSSLEGDCLHSKIDLAYKYLSLLARKLNYNLWDCLQSAYNVISKRTGGNSRWCVYQGW